MLSYHQSSVARRGLLWTCGLLLSPSTAGHPHCSDHYNIIRDTLIHDIREGRIWNISTIWTGNGAWYETWNMTHGMAWWGRGRGKAASLGTHVAKLWTASLVSVNWNFLLTFFNFLRWKLDFLLKFFICDLIFWNQSNIFKYSTLLHHRLFFFPTDSFNESSDNCKMCQLLTDYPPSKKFPNSNKSVNLICL